MPQDGIVEICRNFTSVCVQRYPDESFDYVYLDARHDYKGVAQDLENWYPTHGSLRHP